MRADRRDPSGHANEPAPTVNSSPRKQPRRIDAELALIAERQHGVISLTQLVDAGLDSRTVRNRAASGRLHRLHLGVYAVGHTSLTREGRWMAAVLWGGDGASLTHQAAGAHHGLRAWSGRPTITLPRQRRSNSRVKTHQRVIPADEITVIDGIATTTVPRTILDLASILDRHGLDQVIREAEVRRLSDPLSLPDLLERYPGRRGTATLRSVLAELEVGGGITKQELESRFARFLDAERLPRPERNASIRLGNRFVVPDCLWREHRLIVELDGHDVHDRRIQSDSDKERDRELLLIGWSVIRVTWRHLHAGRPKLAADLRRLRGPNLRCRRIVHRYCSLGDRALRFAGGARPVLTRPGGVGSRKSAALRPFGREPRNDDEPGASRPVSGPRGGGRRRSARRRGRSAPAPRSSRSRWRAGSGCGSGRRAEGWRGSGRRPRG
jgi:very-short-patch-repair endonuclease